MARSGKKYKEQTLARKQKRERKAEGSHVPEFGRARPKLYEEKPRSKRYPRSYEEEAA